MNSIKKALKLSESTVGDTPHRKAPVEITPSIIITPAGHWLSEAKGHGSLHDLTEADREHIGWKVGEREGQSG